MSDGEGSILLQLFESLSASKWVIIGVVLLILELVTGTTYILSVSYTHLTLPTTPYV